MAYLRIADARAASANAMQYRVQKSASATLREEARAVSKYANFDVFLSHSYDDADTILGVKKLIEALGLSVYVDWVDDPGLDRGSVTRGTAEVLRHRLNHSKSLVYAHSANTPNSKWMPWELGYFDGRKPKFVWILPLVVSYDHEFTGQEYLGLYPTVDKLAGLAGKIGLGFEIGSGASHQIVNLREAANGTGVYYRSTFE